MHLVLTSGVILYITMYNYHKILFIFLFLENTKSDKRRAISLKYFLLKNTFCVESQSALAELN